MQRKAGGDMVKNNLSSHPSFIKTRKSQLTAEQPPAKNSGTYQNRHSTSKDKEATAKQ